MVLFDEFSQWPDLHFLALTTANNNNQNHRNSYSTVQSPNGHSSSNVTLSTTTWGGDQDLQFTDEETEDLKRESDQAKYPISVSTSL